MLKRIFFITGLSFIWLGFVSWHTIQPNKSTIPPTQDSTEKVESIRLITWNGGNYGKSKDETEIQYFATIIRWFDVAALQEVSTGIAGAQAVAQLADELNRTGSKWDYVLSDPTTGKGSERYAFFWKTSKLKLLGRPWLEQSLEATIDREPYMARFKWKDKTFLLASIHTVPTAKKPQTEIEQLPVLHKKYESDNLLIMGDFNLSQKHKAFDGLKLLGYQNSLTDQKTSLKAKEKDGEHLANEYDNIFYEDSTITKIKSGVIDFSYDFETLKEARQISDHIPAFLEFIIK